MQQTPTLAPGSIGENLRAPFAYKSARGANPPTDEEIAALLDEFRLSDFGPEDSASNLSAGQKQRICMIRTLFLEPEIMLLDEPVSALDKASAEILLNRAGDLNGRKGVTILMVTHAPVEIEAVEPLTLRIEHGKAFFR
jgi:putative ABC transport system ATP-binding protein